MDGLAHDGSARRTFPRHLGPALALLATACSEPVVATWVLPEHARAFALRSEVVLDGPFDDMLAPVPADRRRVDALPGDTIELTLFAADRQHVLDPEELDAAYYVCGSCFATLRGDRLDLPCDGTVETLVLGCRIGRGDHPRITLPDDGSLATAAAALSTGLVAFAIAGVPEVGDTDACIDAVRTRPFGDLGDCNLVQQSLSLGPTWVLSAALLGIESLDDLPPELSPELFLQPPNFAPEVERFMVEADGATAPTIVEVGDTIDVRPGQSLRVEIEIDPRDRQRSILAIEDGEPRRRVEYALQRWFTSAELPGMASDREVFVDFVVPERSEAAPLRLDVLRYDGAGGVAWGSLYLRMSGG